MHAVVVDDGDVAGFPVVTYAVVNFIAVAVKNIKPRFVDVTMLLRFSAEGILFKMDMKKL